MLRLVCVCLWGVLAAPALAAPVSTRNWVPCLSTIKGYGYCEETLFWAGQSYPHQETVHQQQIYHPSNHQQSIYRPSHQHLADYQQQVYFSSHHLPEYQSEINPGGTDHFIVILRPDENEAPASNSSEINALFDRLFTIMEAVRKENHKREEERRAREPTFDYRQIDEAFKKINQVTQKVTRLVFATAYLQEKLKENITSEVPHYDQLDKIVGNIEKASVNITNMIAKLKESKEKCSPEDEHCKSGHKIEKCSPDDEHCKSEHKIQKCSPEDEHCKSEQKNEKCSPGEEGCKSEHEVVKCSLDEENCKLDQKVDIDEREHEVSKGRGFLGETNVTKEIDNISDEVDKADSQVADALEKLDDKDGGKDILENVESVTDILEDIYKQPPKESTTVKRDPNRLNKEISELDNATLINRLVEDVHDLANQGIDNLETVTAKELSDADREKAFDALVKSKFTNDDEKYAEVTALDDQLANFGKRAQELIEKKVPVEDLSKAIEALGGENPETDLAEKYEEVTKEDVDSLKEIIKNLSASGVPLNKIQDLATKLDDLDKEIKGIILEAKGIDETVLDSILGEKRVRNELNDFGKILSNLYEKGITQESVDKLDKKVGDLKNHSIGDILSTLEAKRKKREVNDETNVFDELYDLLTEIVTTNFADASVDAYVSKVDELTSGNVTKATIFDTTVKVITAIVDKKDRPTRALKVSKNDLYDAVAHAYKANFSDSSVSKFFREVDGLVYKGVEPSEILGETLSDIFLLMLQESHNLPFMAKAENKELLTLVENAVRSDASEASMSAYNKKIEQLLAQGVSPLQIGVDVIGDLFALLHKEKRPKREEVKLIETYKGLLKELSDIQERLGQVQVFVTNQDFIKDTYRKEHINYLGQARSILNKWLKYTFDQVLAIDADSSLPITTPISQ